MAEDVAAKISIAIQNEDAIQRCNDVEDALKRITAARQKDSAAADSSTSAEVAAAEAKAIHKTSKALQELTTARKVDQTVTQADSKQRDNIDATTESIRKETEAVKERTAAYREERKVTAAEAMGMSEEDYEKRTRQTRENSAKARAESEKRWEEKLKEDAVKAADAEKKEAERVAEERIASIEREKAAARSAIEAEKKATAEAQREAQSLSDIKLKDLEEEIKENNILIAQQERLAAIAKEQQTRKKLRTARQNLANEKSRGEAADPRVIKLHSDEVKKYEKQLNEAARATLRAEQNLRKLNNETKKTANAKPTSSENANNAKLLQTNLRGLNAILSKIPGGSVFSIPTEGLGQGGSMGRLAGWGAAGAIITGLIGKHLAIRDENYQASRAAREREMDDLSAVTAGITKESDQRLQLIQTLKEYSQKNKLTILEQVQQADALEKLRHSLSGLIVEIDQTSGRIKNMGDVAEAVQEAERKKKIDAYERELRQLQADQERDEREIGAAVTDKERNALASKMMKTGNIAGVTGVYVGAAIHNAVKWFKDATIDRGRMQQIEREFAPRQQKMAELQRQIADERKKGTPEGKAKSDRTYIAGLMTKDKELAKAQKVRIFSSADKGQVGKIREAEFEKYSPGKIQELQYETMLAKRELDRLGIKDIQTEKDPAKLKEYRNLYDKYMNSRLNLEEAEKKYHEANNYLLPIEREIGDMREKLDLQKKINEGKGREADIDSIRSRRNKRIFREGWSREKANEMAKLEAEELDMNSKINVTSGFGKSAWSYRDTSAAAVMANSMESMRLQSRMLVQNSPQQQLLNVNQKQAGYQEQMLRILQSEKRSRGTNNNSYETITV